MRKIWKKGMTTALIMVMMGTLLVGCKKNKDQDTTTATGTQTSTTEAVQSGEEDSKRVLNVLGEPVYVDEVNVYIALMKEEYSIFGEEIYAMDMGDGQTFEDVLKEQIIEQIRQVKIMNKKAEEQNITLTEEEQAEIEENIKGYIESFEEEDFKESGLTEEAIRTVVTENMYATKIYDSTTAEVDTEVSDEEARQTTTYNLLFTTIEKTEEGENKYDEEGNVVYVSEEEQKKIKKKARKALKEIQGGADIEEVAEEYKVSDESSEYSFGKGEAVEAYETAAYKLKDGEISGLVETEYGYHIIQMISLNDEEATAQKKEEIVQERQNEVFNTAYEEWIKNYSFDNEKDINWEVWDSITFISDPSSLDVENSGIGIEIEDDTEDDTEAATE